MIRKKIAPIFLLAGFFVPDMLLSQTLYSNKQGKAMIRADSSCQSAIVTNFKNTRGDQTQLLATASIPVEGDSLLECRSFLQFNMAKLPPDLKADHIISATLVLFPMAMVDNEGNIINPEPVEIRVKRIRSAWEDSLLSWEKQPMVDEETEVLKKVSAKKMEHAVDITVTKQVKKMFREGNYGFMITNTGFSENINKDVNWFGSARHRVLQFRPVLMLEYVDPHRTAEYIQSGTPFAGIRLSELDDAYRRDMETFRANSVPVNTGSGGSGSNPPPPPVKTNPKD